MRDWLVEWLLFYWRVFIGELLDHLPIVGALLFLLVILAGGLRGLGLPHLFWHRRWGHRAAAGLASGFLVAFTFYVAYLVDAEDCARELARSKAFGWLREWPGGWYFVGCLACLAVTAAVAFALPRLGRLVTRVPRAERVEAERSSWMGGRRIALFVVFAAAFAVALSVAALIWWSVEKGAMHDRLAGAGFVDVVMVRRTSIFITGHRFALIVATALTATLLVGAWGRRRLPASISICVLLAWVIAVDGYLAFNLRAPILGVALLACLMLLAGRARYKVRLERLAEVYDDPAPLALGWTPAGPNEALRMPTWAEDGPTLVLVAVSGGGIRAAVWTAAVLTELEQLRVNGGPVITPWNLGLITGASGGMVGATYYTLTLRTRRDGDDWHVLGPDAVGRERLVDAVAEESLSDIAQRLVFHDMPLAFLPKRISRGDRGTRLDEALERHLRERLPDGVNIPSTIAAMRPYEQAGLYPSLVYTPMLIEDGRRLFISNAELCRLTLSEGRGLDGVETYSRNAFQFHDLFPGYLKALSPWTAARLSASFPYVTPAAVLPTRPRRRVVDAGYWDNFGVNLCSSWLEDCLFSEARRQWLGRFRNVLLLQIRDGVLSYSAVEPPEDERTRTLSRGLEWLSSPPEAVLAARNAVAVYRGDEQVEALSQIFGDRFSTAKIEFHKSASLSWALTDEEEAIIRADARDQVQAIQGGLARFVAPALAPIERPGWFHHAGGRSAESPRPDEESRAESRPASPPPPARRPFEAPGRARDVGS